MSDSKTDDTAHCEKCENHAIGAFGGDLLCQMHASIRKLNTETDQSD